MLALPPAPAPTSGVRWTDLPTPLESALPSCCLSYKQSAFLPPLCFHNLTNPFSRKSFPFTSIQNPGGVPYCCFLAALCAPVPLPAPTLSGWQTPSFQQLAASFSLLPLFFELASFVFRDLQPLLAKHRGW